MRKLGLNSDGADWTIRPTNVKRIKGASGKPTRGLQLGPRRTGKEPGAEFKGSRKRVSH